MGFIWTLGKQEFHKAIKVVLKSFPDFIIFHTVCNSPSWLLKNDTQLCFGSQLCLLAGGGGGPTRGWGRQRHPEPFGVSHQRGGTGAPHRHGRVQPCGLLLHHRISELLSTLLDLLSSRINVKKETHTWKAVGKIQEKNLTSVEFHPILRQFSFLYFLLQVFVLLFLVSSGVIQAPTNSQYLIFTSIFSPDSEHIFCLFQRAHWVSCRCRTDGTTLRFALVNGQMRSFCSSPLTSSLGGEVCLCEPGVRGQQCSGTAAISRQRGRTGRSPNLPELNRHSGSMCGCRHGISQSQHKNQTLTVTFPPGLQE